MNTQHPLKVEKQGDAYAVITAQGNFFARTYSEYDARQIAAMPEMLESLKALRHAYYVEGRPKALLAAFQAQSRTLRDIVESGYSIPQPQPCNCRPIGILQGCPLHGNQATEPVKTIQEHNAFPNGRFTQ